MLADSFLLEAASEGSAFGYVRAAHWRTDTSLGD
jgi:hypothetical protein